MVKKKLISLPYIETPDMFLLSITLRINTITFAMIQKQGKATI